MKKLNLFIVVLVCAGNLFAADPLTERLQRGLFEEEANRNLDAAIREYQSVVTQADEQRKVVATALFRLGECYRKLGRTNEAVAFYQRITRDYSEQEQLAKLAADFLKPALAAAPAGNQPELVREWQRRAAVLKVESMTALMEYDRLTTLSPAQLARSSAATNSPALAQLEPQLLVTEQKLVLLKQQFSDEHPEVKSLTALQKTIRQQYDEALKGIVTAAQQRADSLAAQLRVVDEELKKAGAVANSPPETAAATDDEEKEVRRIQAMIKDSPDLINARDQTGLTPLHLATRNGQVVVAKFLIASRADVNARNSGSAGAGDTPLHLAAARGYKSLVELLLASGADVNANATQGGNGNTPLHLAAEKGFRSVIEVLLANKADINARNGYGETPLHHAVGRGFKAIAELLLAQGTDVNVKTSSDTTPLHLAARISNRDLVELLLAKGAAIDASDNLKATALHLAVQNRNLPIVELLLAKGANPNLTDHSGTTPLSRAVQDGVVNLLGPLLAGGADPNLGDRNAITPLHWAAMLSGGETCAEMLLKNGASVTNRVNWAPGAQPPKNRSQAIIPQGVTPLGLAIGYGQVKTAQLLLDRGADVETMADHANPNGNGNTAPGLEVAIVKNNRAMVKLLLERKANPNIKVYNGWTPLIAAAAAGQKELVELLLANGAELNALAPGGWSPLSAAVHYSKPEVAELLRQRGAIEDLARSSSITVARGGTKVTVFEKGTNDLNRFTLFEALAQHYTPGQNPFFQFPDLARVQVRSIRSKAGEPGRMIDLDTAFRFTNCAANVALEWGDLIELPEQDHVVNAGWPGLASTARATFLQCLRKQVQIIVKGQTNVVVLMPPLAENRWGQPGGIPMASPFPVGQPEPVPATSLTVQRLNDVVRGANVIRSSSDLTRVKVIRSGGERWEKVFDLTQTDKTSDLWLRDGDVIEVPEKP